MVKRKAKELNFKGKRQFWAQWFNLWVLLVKWPDMSEPTFRGQYLFVCIIKSTYQVDVPVTNTWDLRVKTVPWLVILDLGPRQKWVDRPLKFFKLFMFPGGFLHTLQHIKNLEYPFSFFAKYGLFSLATGSKNKNFVLYLHTLGCPIQNSLGGILCLSR